MKTIEDLMWPCMAKGFQGLTGMIGQHLRAGLKPTDYLITHLEGVRANVDALIKDAHERKASPPEQ
jgi:hypothetical protein